MKSFSANKTFTFWLLLLMQYNWTFIIYLNSTPLQNILNNPFAFFYVSFLLSVLFDKNNHGSVTCVNKISTVIQGLVIITSSQRVGWAMCLKGKCLQDGRKNPVNVKLRKLHRKFHFVISPQPRNRVINTCLQHFNWIDISI